jgi:UDP-N-acetylmuramoyl-L-alanyl-D-glutamate--2,6-diaminopimelate ligase
VRLTELLDDVDVVEVRGALDGVDVTAVEFDSRRVRTGALFCCVPGTRTDGHLYATEAMRSGAVALLVERILDLDVPQLRVAEGEARTAMAGAATAFFKFPARDLVMAGITGTNGKTTVAQLVRSILIAAGMPTEVIGTLTGERTTPESPDLQAKLAEHRDAGCDAVAMEVSSHALTQHRVDGIVFDVAAFTNLSHDHLDHHHTMEAYFAAKASLFTPDRSRLAVVNVDDPWGERLARQLPGSEVVAVRRSDAADIELVVGSSSFQWRGHRVTMPLTGVFNVDNALLAAAASIGVGATDDAVVEGLSTAVPPPGRMEVVTAGPPFAVVVDFAHTPAGLGVALASARRLVEGGRVVCLFGCGGDRDADKRSAMGAVVDRLADVAVLTSDNPRSEDPVAIIEAVRSAMGLDVELVVEPDRAKAIEQVMALARTGDVVVLAGKGHETTQVIGDRAVPFDDRVEARRALALLGIGPDR